MAYSYKAVANEILQKMRSKGENVTPLKLQKLLYYTCGYYLATKEKPLIDHTFEAWDLGPVVPSLYRHFKHFGDSPITSLAFDHDANSGAMIPTPPPNGDKLLDNVTTFVVNAYGNYSGLQLSDMTHADGSPWDKARKENPGIRDADIPREVIRDHFKQFITEKEEA